jgi:hypothetical protein
VTINDYLDDIDRHMTELPKDAEYRSPVYATFRAALHQAELSVGASLPRHSARLTSSANPKKRNNRSPAYEVARI